VLAEVGVPLRRRAIADRLVAAYDRLARDHGATAAQFCAALAIPERTFRSWRARPVAPPPPSAPPSPPQPSRRRDRATGRFALEVTAPGIQLGADTTDVRVLGVDLKLVAAQDLGAREQRLWEAFAVHEHETADLVDTVVASAVAGRDGMQLLTDQGTPFLAETARAAYEALAVDHAPQKEGTPTDKATVERAFGIVKAALAPLLDLTNRLAGALPALRQPELARHLGTLLCAVFLRVYAAGRSHLGHPLAGRDPDLLRAVIEEQRQGARAEDRSVRLFLHAVHAEYAMPGSRDAFVRAFRRYPLDDLRAAERRFRRYACRCVARVCDRYFAAVVRDAHERGQRRRAGDRAARRAAAADRERRGDAARRAAHLDACPQHRLHEGLDLLADTWLPAERRFAADGALGSACLRRAAADFLDRDPSTATDEIERHLRSWLAARPALPHSVRDAVCALLARLIPDVVPAHQAANPAALLGAILPPSARASPDNPRPSRPPRLRI
jgi:hypothetical protein